MKPRAPKADELRPEYDMTELLKGGVMGRYANRFAAGTNLVLIEPEIHHEFKTEKAVNDALRLVIELRKIDGRSRKTATRLVGRPIPSNAIHKPAK